MTYKRERLPPPTHTHKRVINCDLNAQMLESKFVADFVGSNYADIHFFFFFWFFLFFIFLFFFSSLKQTSISSIGISFIFVKLAFCVCSVVLYPHTIWGVVVFDQWSNFLISTARVKAKVKPVKALREKRYIHKQNRKVEKPKTVHKISYHQGKTVRNLKRLGLYNTLISNLFPLSTSILFCFKQYYTQ